MLGARLEGFTHHTTGRVHEGESWYFKDVERHDFRSPAVVVTVEAGDGEKAMLAPDHTGDLVHLEGE